ncbi:MAG: hypothetical protein JW722_03280 [Demequinaceae bacterium]|nr:hypothetical protein [Demequinaceae bacterium]
MPTYRSWQPGFMPLRPLTLNDFLSLPMKAITFNRQVILGGPLLCVIASMLAASVATVLFIMEQPDFFRFYPNADLGPMSAETILAIVVAVLVFIVTDAAARVLVVPGVSRAILGERITLGKAWSITRPRIAQILLLYLLITLMAVAVVLGIAGLAAVGAGAFSVILILAAIPGVLYLSVFMGVAVSAIILERIPATASLSRARSLMKGSAWRLIGNFIVISIILSIISNAITGVAQAGLVAVAETSSLATLAIVTIIFLIVSTVVTTIVQYSFLGSLLTLMYVDLRIRNEGFDVDLARAAEAAAGR